LDGKIYSGQWKNDQMNGNGVIYFPNKSKRVGKWINGKKNGMFIFRFKGKSIKEQWKDGVMEEKEK